MKFRSVGLDGVFHVLSCPAGSPGGVMVQSKRVIPVGDAVVSVFNIGDIHLPLVKSMNVPPELLKTGELRDLASRSRVPIHSTLVQLNGLNILVDAGSYDRVAGTEYELEGYKPPPPLTVGLLSQGVAADAVDHVIITHRHWDHLNATTIERDGVHHPAFPNAMCWMSRRDFEHVVEEVPDRLQEERRILQCLDDAGRLELVDGDRDLMDGIRILAAPGETAGHQVVRIHSCGETLYVLGDMFHHPIELAHPEWLVSWADPEASQESRHRITQAALAEDAALVGTHIRPLGRLLPTTGGVLWRDM